jgi:metal-sulfur cluster biosynthetic enzyme
MTAEEAVRAALGEVLDPELDRSVVSLEFVRAIEVDGPDVRVELRLPTFWCSPSFAYMMVADARSAIEAVPGVRRARVELVDHFAAERVTEGVDEGRPFQAVFPDEADGELEELRRRFRLKAFVVRQEPVLRAACAAAGEAGAGAWRLGGGAPEGVRADRWEEYLARRRDLGMPEGPGELAFTDPQGRPLDPARMADYLRLSRSMRVSLESNTEFCTGLLAARYGGGVEAWQGKEVAA